jgi:urease accessory protein
LSAYGLSVSIVSAALRLGVLGHIDAQRILIALCAPTARLLREPPPEPAGASAFLPLADIASMRHETQDVRLFAN